jgi:hypothetical protein
MCPVAAELFRADAETDRHDVVSSRFFRNFANASKNSVLTSQRTRWLTFTNAILLMLIRDTTAIEL